jgi:hypothetical protein
MGFVAILGIVLLGLGPLTALFVVSVMPHSEQVIVFGSAAFFQLISITLRALLWAMIPPLKTSIIWAVIIGAVVQELVRAAFFAAYRRTEAGFSVPQSHRANSSVSAGIGFAAAQTCMMYLAVTLSATGPGALYLDQCTALSAFSLTALNSCAFGLMETFATVAAFRGWATVGAPCVRASRCVFFFFFFFFSCCRFFSFLGFLARLFMHWSSAPLFLFSLNFFLLTIYKWTLPPPPPFPPNLPCCSRDGTFAGLLLTGKPLVLIVFLLRALASAVSTGNTGHGGCGAVVGAEFALATVMGILAGVAAYRPVRAGSAPL